MVCVRRMGPVPATDCELGYYSHRIRDHVPINGVDVVRGDVSVCGRSRLQKASQL